MVQESEAGVHCWSHYFQCTIASMNLLGIQVAISTVLAVDARYCHSSGTWIFIDISIVYTILGDSLTIVMSSIAMTNSSNPIHIHFQPRMLLHELSHPRANDTANMKVTVPKLSVRVLDLNKVL
jgi:hypothetical protein